MEENSNIGVQYFYLITNNYVRVRLTVLAAVLAADAELSAGPRRDHKRIRFTYTRASIRLALIQSTNQFISSVTSDIFL